MARGVARLERGHRLNEIVDGAVVENESAVGELRLAQLGKAVARLEPVLHGDGVGRPENGEAEIGADAVKPEIRPSAARAEVDLARRRIPQEGAAIVDDILTEAAAELISVGAPRPDQRVVPRSARQDIDT